MLVDRKLLLKIHDPLAQWEEKLLLDETVTGIVLRNLSLELVLELLIKELSQQDLPFKLHGQLAHRPLILPKGHVIPFELVTTLLK